MSTTEAKLSTFVYLGRMFQPYSKQDGTEWVLDYVGEAGRFKHVNKQSRDFKFENYCHADFYKKAATVGADRHNIFLMDGWEVLPCGEFFLGFRRL